MQQGAAGGADPVVEYTLIGDDLSDGVFAWMNLGINPEASRTVSTAAHCSEDGCNPLEV